MKKSLEVINMRVNGLTLILYRVLLATFITLISVTAHSYSSPWDFLFSHKGPEFKGVALVDSSLYLISPETSEYKAITDSLIDYTISNGKIFLVSGSDKLSLEVFKVSSGVKVRAKKLKGDPKSFIGIYSVDKGVVLAYRDRILILNDRLREIGEVKVKGLTDLLVAPNSNLIIALTQAPSNAKWVLDIIDLSKRKPKLLAEVPITSSDSIYPYISLDKLFIFSLFSTSKADGKPPLIKWELKGLDISARNLEELGIFSFKGFPEYFNFSLDGFRDKEGVKLALSNGFSTSLISLVTSSGDEGNSKEATVLKEIASYPGSLVGIDLKLRAVVTERYGRVMVNYIGDGEAIGFDGNSPVILGDGSIAFYRFRDGKLLIYKFCAKERLIKFLIAIPYNYLPEIFSYEEL